MMINKILNIIKNLIKSDSAVQAQIKSIIPESRNIHYGCGLNIFKNFINVDGFNPLSFPGGKIPKDKEKINIFFCDLTKKHPFPDNFFEYGYSEDFIEHLTQKDSFLFLVEVFRTFKKGGVFRLSFPGFKGVIRKHFNVANYDYFVKGKKDAFDMWDHHHFYSEESLEFLCKAIGFAKVNFMSFGESNIELFKNIDSRPDQKDLNIYAEIIK